MKYISMFFLCFVDFCLISCLSIPSVTCYQNYPKQKINYGIVLNDINVSIGLLNDNALVAQVSDIAYAMLNKELDNMDYDQKLYLDIQLSQRSYYQGINQYNSIYLNYKLMDESGNIALNNCYFNKITDSVDSSKVQYKLIKKVVSDVKSYISISNQTK